MSKVCRVSGSRPRTGNNVSHANNKTKRRYLPNLHKRRLWVGSKKKYITLRVTSRGLRILDKIGIDAFLEREQNKN